MGIRIVNMIGIWIRTNKREISSREKGSKDKKFVKDLRILTTLSEI